MNIPAESTVLSSWKDIARYLGKGVRTVQRWELQLGLPVRRPVGASQKSAVLLYRRDVDAWLATRFAARPKNQETALENTDLALSTLKERIRKARELRTTHSALTGQIQESIRQLTERCDLLTSQTVREPWFPASSAAPKLLRDSLPSSRGLEPQRSSETSVR
jgi:hypothetical protein